MLNRNLPVYRGLEPVKMRIGGLEKMISHDIAFYGLLQSDLDRLKKDIARVEEQLSKGRGDRQVILKWIDTCLTELQIAEMRLLYVSSPLSPRAHSSDEREELDSANPCCGGRFKQDRMHKRKGSLQKVS